MKKNCDDEQLTKALAILISSTRSKKRVKPLTEIAKWLRIALQQLGSVRKVADRIGLSPQMLRQFQSVEKLAREVQELFEARELDSVDAATHLAMLSRRDQIYMSKLLASGDIDTSDVRAVHQLRKGGAKESVRSLVRRVVESKTHQEYIAEFVIRGSRTPDQVRDAFSAFIPPDEILRLEIQGVLGRLVLTKKGKAALLAAARTLCVPLSQVIPAILQKEHATP